MDEHEILQRLNESPDDLKLLRDYAEWLIEQGDLRGQHLAAELDLRDAESQFTRAEQSLSRLRSTREQDFDWLNSVLPMMTRAPVAGVFHVAPEPGGEPFVSLGDFCDRGSVVGIIEARKVYFQIAAGHSGLVTEIVARDGEQVAIGAPLVRFIRPRKAVALAARFR